MSIETNNNQPWNKGKLVSQKLPFNIKEIWAIRVRLQIAKKNTISHFSIWQLTVSYGVMILPKSRLAMSTILVLSRREPLLYLKFRSSNQLITGQQVIVLYNERRLVNVKMCER